MAKPRHCFAAGRKLSGTECCVAQKQFRAEVSRLQIAQPSLSGVYDQMIFLPLKVFFVLIVVLIAALLAFRRVELDKYYPELVPPIERGVIIGAFAMLLWPIMDYGYQQTANVLFGRLEGLQLRYSLVIVPWALLLLFYFLKRLGKRGEMIGQIAGVRDGGRRGAALRGPQRLGRPPARRGDQPLDRRRAGGACGGGLRRPGAADPRHQGSARPILHLELTRARQRGRERLAPAIMTTALARLATLSRTRA